MSTNNTSNNSSNSKKKDKLLWLVIAAPILLALVIAGGVTLWTGLIEFIKLMIPNVWILLGYAYIGILGFFIARHLYKK